MNLAFARGRFSLMGLVVALIALLAEEAHTHAVAAIMVTHDHDVLPHRDRVLEMVDGKLSP